MATPTLRAIRTRFASAHITFVAEPNLRDLIRGGDWMDECIEWPVKRERSMLHKTYRDLVWDLRRRRFDWAVLLPNSFRSALLVRLAGVKRRIGYARDGRGWLMTDRVPCRHRRTRGDQSNGVKDRFDTPSTPSSLGPSVPEPLTSSVPKSLSPSLSEPLTSSVPPSPVPTPTSGGLFAPHRPVRVGSSIPGSRGPFAPLPMVDYYADLAVAIGCPRPGDRMELFTTAEEDASVGKRFDAAKVERIADAPSDSRATEDGLTDDWPGGASPPDRRPLVVMSPGAKYGAAKCWAPERFAALSDRLVEQHGAIVIVTCGPGEESIVRAIGDNVKRDVRLCIDPLLTLGQLKSLVRRCELLVCNDAGPRHFAKAFNVPVVTIFGPTHPQWTATSYTHERIVRVDIDCGPCQQRTCPLGHVQCMTSITVDMVHEACCELLPASIAGRDEHLALAPLPNSQPRRL